MCIRDRGRRLVLAALVLGLAAGWVYARWAPIRLWLRYLAPAPLVFALVFATLSPTAELILPARAGSQGALATQTRPGRPLPPVVMVLFDEFPVQSLLDSSGQVDRRVYPNFAASPVRRPGIATPPGSGVGLRSRCRRC